MQGSALVGEGLRVLLQTNATSDGLESPADTPPDEEIQPHAGAWARGWDVFMCLLPIAFLITTTLVKRLHMDTSKSLPLAAVFMWIIRLAYLKLDPLYTNAAVVYGLFNALTPLSIIAGAICLFQAMEQTKCLPWMMGKVRSLSSGHPVAEVFLIGWAFVYMIEGASGFGTPVALAAPMLVSLGHPPVESITCCLIMDTLATVHGAVGFPIWFGLAGLDPPLDDDDLRTTGFRAQVFLFAVAHVVPLIAASFLVRWKDLARSWLFVLLSIWAAKLPALGIALVSTDFSTLIGGMIAVLLVGLLATFRIGLNRDPGHKFDLPPLEAAVSYEREQTASSGAEGSTHITSLKRRPAPASPPAMQPAGKLGRDAMLAPNGVGVFRDPPRAGAAAARGGMAERQGSGRVTAYGPAAVSGVAGEEFDEDLFTTADGLDSASAPLPPVPPAVPAAGGDSAYRAHNTGQWTVYSSDNDWGQAHGRAVGEGLDNGSGAGEVGVAEAAYVSFDRHGVPSRWSGSGRGARRLGPQSPLAHGHGVELQEVAAQPAARALGEGRGRLQPKSEGGKIDAVPYPKHDIPQLRSLESMDSDLESARHRHSGAGGDDDLDNLDPGWPRWLTLVLRTMPLWLTVLLLLITRIEPLGVRDVIQDPEPNFAIDLGYLLRFELSASLVVRISRIFALPPGTLVWSYQLLYIPFLVPFVVVSIVTVLLFRRNLPAGSSVLSPFAEAGRRAAGVVPALLGSLVLVALLREAAEGTEKPAYIIGFNLADFMKEGFIAIAAPLGALGSFFSGSTTVSNLTFGIVHQVAARNIGVSTTALLALQSVGATAGNMICINNIIAAKAVVGGAALAVSEGAFIARTSGALAAMLTIATLVALPFLFA